MALTNGDNLVTVEGLRSVYDLINNDIKSKVSTVYKPCGTVKFADLPEPSAETLGNVYNIEDAFTTNAKFVEGKGKECTAGANVGIIVIKNTDGSTGEITETYKYDLFNASVDLTGYVTQGQLTNFNTNISNYVKDIQFQPDNTNTITVIKGNGTSSTYTLNVGKNADVITDITIDTSLSTNLGAIGYRRIKRTDNKVSLWWVDPDDTSDGDAWGETVIVKKKNSYPNDMEDGTLVLICAVKNKYKTSPYIDEQENPELWYYRAFPVSTNGAVSNSILNRFDFWHYGVCIDENNPIESESVTYLQGYDNENYKPLKVVMGNDNSNIEDNRCDWGNWKDAPFMPRPCMLKYDGTVDYYLNPDDYTLKENGEASDVSNTAYEGNAMMEFSPIFVKAKRVVTPASEDGQTPESSKLYLYFCSHKYDDDYECYSCLKEDGTYADHFYMSIYEATNVDGKFRSLSLNKVPTVNISGGLATCLNLAKKNGQGWCVDLWNDADLLRCLFILITKRLNSRATIGYGCGTYNCCATGSSNKKGMFWGTVAAQTLYGTKYFGIENFWGHNYHYCAGILSPDKATFHVKNTYSIADGTTGFGYNATGAGYTKTGISRPASGYEKKINGEKGLITMPVAVGGSNTTYYTDYFYGGSYDGFWIGGYGSGQAGVFCVLSYYDASYYSGACGARLSYKGH